MKSRKVQDFLLQNSTRIPGYEFPQISVVQASVAAEHAERLREDAAAEALAEMCQNRVGDRCADKGRACDGKCSLIKQFREKINQK